MNKAIVHIGAHKTGTTSLQEMISNEADVLRSFGVEPLVDLKSDVRLTLAQEGRFESERLYEHCKKSVGKHSIISCESIDKITRAPEMFSGLHSIVEPHFDQVKYWLFLRDYLSWTTSNVQQTVKMLYRGSYKNIYENFMKISLDRKFAVFWQDDAPLLEISSFEDTIKKGSEFFYNELEEYFEIDCGTRAELPVSNTSIGREGVALCFAVNYFLNSLVPNFPSKVDFKLGEPNYLGPIKREIITDIARVVDGKKKFMPFSEEQQVEGLKVGRRKAKRLIKRFPGVWQEQVFQERTVPEQICLISELPEERRVELTSTLEEYIDVIIRTLSNQGLKFKYLPPASLVNKFLEEERKVVFS